MVEIRDAVSADVPEMMDIYNNAVRNTTFTFDLEEKTLIEREEWFRKYGNPYPLLVAVLQSQVVGYCSLSRFRERAAYDLTVELSIYISETHRGNGIGSALMQEVISRGKTLGFHTVISGITSNNVASQKLHEKFGFAHVGHLREVGKKFGTWQDVHYYQRILQHS